MNRIEMREACSAFGRTNAVTDERCKQEEGKSLQSRLESKSRGRLMRGSEFVLMDMFCSRKTLDVTNPLQSAGFA